MSVTWNLIKAGPQQISPQHRTPTLYPKPESFKEVPNCPDNIQIVLSFRGKIEYDKLQYFQLHVSVLIVSP